MKSIWVSVYVWWITFLFALRVRSFSFWCITLLVNEPVQRTKLSGEYEKGEKDTKNCLYWVSFYCNEY